MSQNWKPFPDSPQEFVLRLPPSMVYEILFGGSRGGGKTDAGMVWLLDYVENPRYRALVLRKNYDDLVDWIDRAKFMYSGYGAKIGGQPVRCEFPSGAIFRLGHLKDRTSYEKYLGHEYQKILLEELTQIPKEEYYRKIMGSCRSTIDGLTPQMMATTNPGGVGHVWVKKKFIDPSPPNKIFKGEDGKRKIFVPANIDDNPVLKEKDPGYVEYLDGLKRTDPDLWRAWRLGDWDVFAGQFFKIFRRDLHVVNPFKPKKDLLKFGGVDWGRTANFVFLAMALQKVKYPDCPEFNRLWVYRELVGNQKSPKEWSDIIKSNFDLGDFKQIMGDPSMRIKQHDGSRSILDQFKEEGIIMLPANNDRVNGWEAVQNWLSIAPDGLPYLMISEECRYLIETLPAQVHDENKVEDIDTDGEDHAVDALRYAVVHIKWIDAGSGLVGRPKPKKRLPRTATYLNMDKFK